MKSPLRTHIPNFEWAFRLPYETPRQTRRRAVHSMPQACCCLHDLGIMSRGWQYRNIFTPFMASGTFACSTFSVQRSLQL
ncbi:hypothetical protein DAEQUDRAFT_720474 [Daedalea quercina L-15889]|uniref:Uncharacterized protein n=1 Tax=Daedalea quercina L-15889 TaxID=1314783 RepID=A0A165U2N8_9APHY|nr:hypothetical protein DAEQUDRAFT_720474 [Daedalea quercina L-15889]